MSRKASSRSPTRKMYSGLWARTVSSRVSFFSPKKAECRSPSTTNRQPSKPGGRSRKAGAKDSV